MAVQFITGRSGSGKSTFILNEVKHKLAKNPQGPPLILLVPDQMTFQTEYALVSSPELQGMIRAQVFSFSRLALRVLQEKGGLAKYPLNNVGLTMMLRKIVHDHADELLLFGRAATRPGFYDYLAQMITELKRYRLSAERLEESRSLLVARSKEHEQSELLQHKLHDLQLIYVHLQEQLRDEYLHTEDMLQLLAERISSAAMLDGAEVYVDGFYDFTPQELEVLRQLMKSCQHVRIALTVDEPESEPPDLWSQFYTTTQTYITLSRLARAEGVPLERDHVLGKPSIRFAKRPALSHLEQHFDIRPVIAFDGEQAELNAVMIAAAVSRRAEVEGVAREIRRLVMENNYRWRDMAILTRDAHIYGDLLSTIFEDEDIPIFLDQKEPMLHHPLIEFVRSALDVLVQNWPYEAVFRCIKTDLLLKWTTEDELQQWREKFDYLENHVLAYGMRGSRWLNDEEWSADQSLDELRRMITEPLRYVHEQLQQAHNVQEMCSALFLFLEEIGVPQTLQQWREKAAATGRLLEVRHHEQVWTALIDLLDQLVEMLGTEQLSLPMFRALLDTGCENLRFSLVPPALDQVVAGDMELSRLADVKCVFVLGANEGILPARPHEEGLFTEDEREQLAAAQLKLAPGARAQLSMESFLIYQALTRPSDRLIISYALADEEGRSLMPSSVINHLQNMFPQAEQHLWLTNPYDADPQTALSFISHPEQTLPYMLSMLRQWQKGYPVDDVWWDMYNWLVTAPQYAPKAKSVLRSLVYKNQAQTLSTETANALFGRQLRVSVSRMELFQSCPFAHFAAYGLRLQERQVFRLEAPDIGELFHEALRWVADEISATKQHWASLSAEDCAELAAQAVTHISPTLQHNILRSTHRYHYIRRKLQQVVHKSIIMLSEHAQVSDFDPIGWEVGFGPGQALPSLRFEGPNGLKIELIGRIDRVDKAVGAHGLLLRVIDFKSSQTSLNMSAVYYGLSLQMLTYLDVLITNARAWLGQDADPAGVLYFHLHNPLLQYKNVVVPDELERDVLRQFKMKGLVLADPDTVRMMDQSMDVGHSDIVPAGLKKDGQFYANSAVASQEDFALLRDHMRTKIQEIAVRISSGETTIEPYMLHKRTPCTFCSFKAVCQFDQGLDENQYKLLFGKTARDVLRTIRLEQGGDSK